MKISLIADRCQLEDRGTLLPQVARLLSDWDIAVKLLIPDACYFNLAHIQPTADLYLLASNTPLALTLAGMLQALGATFVNPYPVANALHNKLIGLRTLQAHGLPIPEIYAATTLAQLKELLTAGPLLIKPQCATRPESERQSHRPVYHVRELPATVTPHMPLIAQRYLESVAPPWQVTCIGGRLFGLDHGQPVHRSFRNNFSPPSPEERGRYPFFDCDCNLADNDGVFRPAELSELALRCGQAFDIDLFSIKVIEHNAVLYVVDMVNFPDCQATPEVTPRLAEYLYARAQLVLEKRREPITRTIFSAHAPGSVASPHRLSHAVYA